MSTITLPSPSELRAVSTENKKAGVEKQKMSIAGLMNAAALEGKRQVRIDQLLFAEVKQWLIAAGYGTQSINGTYYISW